MLKKVLNVIYFIISLLPLVWIVITYIPIINSFFLLGHIPKYRIDNISDQLFMGGFFFGSSVLILSVILWSHFLWIGLTYFLCIKRILNKKLFVLYIVGAVLLIYLNLQDPYGLLEWFYD